MQPQEESPEAALRPARLPPVVQAAVISLLAASFVSGTLIWWGESVQAERLETPSWIRVSLLVHGSLNPLLCVAFGVLLTQHIRYGWQLKANRASGLVLECTFGGLILSGLGLYYVGSEWQEVIKLVHRILGLLLPLALGLHWVMAQFWIKKVQKRGCR